ncbi:MAG: 50S ribosomal protein L21 [Patescibacteria group bacterium]
MAKFAIIDTGGKQYLTHDGETLSIEKLPVDEGGKVVFDKVLLTVDGETITVGKPYIVGVTIEADVLKQGRGRKIRIMRYHSKTRQRRRQGHRQPFTQVKVKSL